MLKTEQILNAKFTPVSKGTYSAEEVDAFLKSVAESYEESLNQNRELMKKISILADKIESYRNDEEAIKLSLLDAHRMAETVSKNAEEKADAKISDAESKSKIILDGANRQSTQMIDEAREKAKEIVDNARSAVASLTERAQAETEKAIVSAQNKADEIVAAAKSEGESIIGTSKQSYEFYSAQLAKVKAETEKFKETVKALCGGQLNLLDSIPEFAVEEAEAAEEIIPEAVIEEPAEEEAPIVYEPEEAPVAVEEELEAVEEEFEEAETELAEEIEEVIVEIEDAEEIAIDDIPEVDDDDDLFSFIEDIELEDVSDDSIPASLDDLIPSAPVVIDEPAEEEVEAEDDEFDGFKIDLDSIDGLGSDNDDDDDDITSLFDSLFDE